MSKPRHELKYFINTADYLAIKKMCIRDRL